MPLLRAQGADRDHREGAGVACAVRRAPRRRARRRARPPVRRCSEVALLRVADAADGLEARARRKPPSSRTSTPRPTTLPDRVHLRHDRQAEGHDALSSRRDGGVRLLAAHDAACDRATTSSSAARRSRSRSGWAACCCFRCASAPRRCCSRSRRPTRCLRAIAAHRATVLFTAPTSYRAMAPRVREARPSRRCASASRPARRCRRPRASCGRTRPASRSSTASARPRCCTSSSRTTKRMRGRARPASRCPATGVRGGRRGQPLPRRAGRPARGEGPDRLPLPRRRAPGQLRARTAGTTPATPTWSTPTATSSTRRAPTT